MSKSQTHRDITPLNLHRDCEEEVRINAHFMNDSYPELCAACPGASAALLWLQMTPAGRCNRERRQNPGNKGWNVLSSSSAELQPCSWSPWEPTVSNHKFGQAEQTHSSIQSTAGCRRGDYVGANHLFHAWPQEWKITSSQSFQQSPTCTLQPGGQTRLFLKKKSLYFLCRTEYKYL